MIRTNRKRRGVSQEALAASAGLNRTYLGSIERGEAMPSLRTLQQLADALSLKLSELVEQYERQDD